PHPFRLLRPRRTRPRHSRAAEQRDEVAPPHSITSSAVASSVGGTLRPSVRAVCRLMTNSNLVGRITGSSDGFSQDATDIDPDLAILLSKVCPIAHQSADIGQNAIEIDRR